MELTKRALGFLRRQYTLILKKNHLANALAVAGLSVALALGPVGGTAHADDGDYANTLNDSTLVEDVLDTVPTVDGETTTYPTGYDADTWATYTASVLNSTSSAYTVEEVKSNTDYYTTFTKYVANDDGTLSSVEYGVSLNTSDESTDANSIEEFITNYTTDSGYTFVKVVETTDGEGNTTTNLPTGVVTFTDADGNTYYIKDKDNNTITSTITGSITTNDSDNTASGVYIFNTNGTQSGNTDDLVGGALCLTGIKEVTTVKADFIANSTEIGGAIYHDTSTMELIEGDFIGNTTTEGRGAAITNYSGIVYAITGNFIANTSAGFGTINNSGTIGTITGNFIANKSKTGSGGAIVNNSGTINTIVADFIGNTTAAKGGAIWNTGTSKIYVILGDFIQNTASGNWSGTGGGAIFNESTIYLITGNFIQNTANYSGGAIYNSGTIATIVSSFYENSAAISGGAVYTSTSLTFLADDETLYFVNNYVSSDGGTTKTYNAIYATSGVTLTFDMDGTGDFIMNDSITGAAYTTNKGDTYTVAIVGEAEGTGVDEANYFYLNDKIDNNGFVTVTDANLTLGTYIHDDNDTEGVNDDSVTVADMYFTNSLLDDNAKLYVDLYTGLGDDVDDYDQNYKEIILDSDEALTVGSDNEFIVQSGTFDISAGVLTVEKDAVYETEEDGTLIVSLDNYGYSVDTSASYLSKNLTHTAPNDKIAQILDNTGKLILEENTALTINKAVYLYLLDSIDSTDWTASGQDVSTTDNVTVDFTNLSLTGYYSLNSFSYYDDELKKDIVNSDTTVLNEFIMAGDLVTDYDVTAAGIVKNDAEFDGDAITASTIAGGATLTLTGETFYVSTETAEIDTSNTTTTLDSKIETGSTDSTKGTATNTSHILLDEGTLTNYGTLYLGVTGAGYTSKFNGTLTATKDSTSENASTTTVYSAVDFANKTTVNTGATLNIKADSSNTVTMAGLDVGDIDKDDTSSTLYIESGTLELVEDSANTSTTQNTASSDFNAWVGELIADSYAPDSDIDGDLNIVAGATLNVSSGVTNIVDANLWGDNDSCDIKGTITITETGTVVAAFDDFVSGAATGAKTDGIYQYGETKLTTTSMMEDKVELSSDAAILILDGEKAYINKEDFAEFLTGDDWTDFVKDSTGSTASLAIDYGANDSHDTGDYTLDNTYTYDTESGTITITNLHLTSYYSLTYYLANADTNGDYILAEPVITGELTGNTSLVAPTLLQGDTQSSTIASGSTLTLTGAGYTDENSDAVVAGVLVNDGSVTNNGTLILGFDGASDDATFNGTLTTTSTSTTTILSDVTFTEEVKVNTGAQVNINADVTFTSTANIAGDLTVADTASVTADGSSITIAATALTDTNGDYTLDFDTYAHDGSTLVFGTSIDTADTEYTYIMSEVDSSSTKNLLYVSLDDTLYLDSDTSLSVGTNSSTTPDVYFGSDSLFIADLDGFDSTTSVITADGQSLYVDADSTLGLLNASAGTYTILDGFSTTDGDITIFDTNADGDTVPWSEDSVYLGNALLEVDYVTGSGATGDPYLITVRVPIDSDLYEGASGDLIEEIAKSDNFSADSTDPLGKLLYNSSKYNEKSPSKVAADVSGVMNLGTTSGSSTSGMTAVRTTTATFDIRNTVAHVGNVASAGGTLIVKDENGNVTAEYDNVIEVAFGGSASFSDAPSGSDAASGLGGAGSNVANSIGLWAMPFYAHESISGAKMDGFSNDYRTDMYGVTMGIDKTFAPRGVDVCRLGLAFNVGTGETTSGGDFSPAESDFDFFGLATYGSMRIGEATISGSVSYTRNSSESVQTFDYTDAFRAETDTDVWYAVLNGEYSFGVGTEDETDAFTHYNIVPYAGIGFMTSKTEDYDVMSGNTAVTRVESERQNIVTFPIGIKFNEEFESASGWIAKPQVGIGGIFAAGDLYDRSTSKAIGYDTVGRSEMQVVDRTTLDLDFSIDLRKDAFGIFLDYDVQFSETRVAHGVSAKFEFRF